MTGVSYLYTMNIVIIAFAMSTRFTLKLQLELVHQSNDMHQSGTAGEDIYAESSQCMVIYKI